MEHTIATYFLYFIIIAICGWIMEVTLQFIQKHKFADRGFLIGPYCPIYGVGALFITLGLSRLEAHPMALFCVAIVNCDILEYATSYIMEKIFHARWWDYSENKFNINGRICLETIIPFGLLGILLIYIINPFIFDILNKIPKDLLNYITVIVAMLFLVDNIVSLRVILNVSSTTKKFDKENPKDSTEEISQKVKEFLRGKSFLNRRLIDAFPKLTAVLKEQSERIKQKTLDVKEELSNKANEMKEDFNEKAEEVKTEINQKAQKVKNEINHTSRQVKRNIAKAKIKNRKKKKHT